MNPLQYEAELEERFKARFAERFYSTIEMSPGEFTTGTMSGNIALTREMLKKTEVEGKDCIDVAAVDGWCCILFSRRGASKVVAFDRNDFSPLIAKVESNFGLDIEYHPLVKSTDWAEVARKAGHTGFDVVINSGLLYHVLGPVNTLAASRSLVRTGGIMIVETVFDPLSDDFTMSFNSGGRNNANDPTFFWSLSPKVYDYLLRMLRLVPIDMAYTGSRMAIACRAVSEVVPPKGDVWLPETYKARDILDLTDWSILDHSASVAFDARETAQGIDVYETYKNTAKLEYTQDQVRIRLCDAN